MNKLSNELRELMIHKLADGQAESMADSWDGSDFYDLVIDGYKGLKDSTDLDLYEEFLERFEYRWTQEATQVTDYQIQALRVLKERITNKESKKEIQSAIDRRVAELNGNEIVAVELDEEDKKLKEIAERAHKELGL